MWEDVSGAPPEWLQDPDGKALMRLQIMARLPAPSMPGVLRLASPHTSRPCTLTTCWQPA